LSAEIEADEKKIAKLPGLIEKPKRKNQRPWLKQTSSRHNSPPCPTLREITKNGWRISIR
jgi:hypothetical protein